MMELHFFLSCRYPTVCLAFLFYLLCNYLLVEAQIANSDGYVVFGSLHYHCLFWQGTHECACITYRNDLNKHQCSNTGNGIWYIADSTGRVCPRHVLNYKTGCCPSDSISPQYACETCEPYDSCCSSYEHCVSCCMAPKNQPERSMLQSYIGMNK